MCVSSMRCGVILCVLKPPQTTACKSLRSYSYKHPWDFSLRVVFATLRLGCVFIVYLLEARKEYLYSCVEHSHTYTNTNTSQTPQQCSFVSHFLWICVSVNFILLKQNLLKRSLFSGVFYPIKNETVFWNYTSSAPVGLLCSKNPHRLAVQTTSVYELA